MNNWVAVRRTYVFTSQEVEKICRTLQSHMILVWTIRSGIASFLQVAILHSGRLGHGSLRGEVKFNVQRSPRRSEVKLGMKDVTEQVQKVDELELEHLIFFYPLAVL